MNIENLKERMVIKNYKELCKLLDEKVKSGNSKKSQLKDWERYICYHKDGNKFIIDKILEEPLEKEDKRITGNNSIYSDYIQSLILDMLIQKENNGQVFLSCNQLLRKLQMVSVNYSKGRNDILKLSEILKIKEEVVKDVYSYTHIKLKNAIETALNSLQKQSLIEWYKKKTVCVKKIIPELNELGEFKLDKDNKPIYSIQTNYREATIEEIQIILKWERIILDELNCKDKRDLIIHDLMDVFRKKINSKLKEDCNIEFYYESYEIITHKQTLLNRLGRFEKVLTYEVLNETILEQTYKTIESKHENVCQKYECQFGEHKPFDNKTDEIRFDEQYVGLSKQVSDKILDRKARRINKLFEKK